jgi:mRNA-degrading endonuclease RelE of RelBE toxin-antitoxin system
MTPHQPRFFLIFAPEAIDHLAAIERKYHSLIEAALDEQLAFNPTQETRNRKLLEQPAPFSATWELRFGSNNRFRAFYEVNSAENVVNVLAIGVKEGNRLFVGNEEFKI